MNRHRVAFYLVSSSESNECRRKILVIVILNHRNRQQIITILPCINHRPILLSPIIFEGRWRHGAIFRLLDEVGDSYLAWSYYVFRGNVFGGDISILTISKTVDSTCLSASRIRTSWHQLLRCYLTDFAAGLDAEIHFGHLRIIRLVEEIVVAFDGRKTLGVLFSDQTLLFGRILV